MATMTVSLPDSMKDWIDEQVRSGDYASSSEYLGDLVERDQRERLNALREIVDEALAGGISPRTTRQIFDEAVEIARARGTLRE